MTNLKKISVLLCLFIFCSFAGVAQTGVQQPIKLYKIAGITVEGNIFADAQTVINNSGLSVGDEISIPSEKFASAINRLWNQRLYSDLKIFEDKIIGDQIFLIIRIKEHNRLDKWEFKGLDEFDDKDLEKVITLIKGQILTPATLKRWERAIKAKYEKDGYLQTTVSFDQQEITPGRVNLVITVNEGPVIIIKKITFHGNNSFSNSDLVSEFKDTKQDAWWRIFGGPKFKKAEFEKDKDLLTDFYGQEGFKDFRIVRDSVSYDPKDNSKMYLDIWVYEGNKYVIRHIDWVGNKLFDDQILNERLGFKKGDVYNKKKMNQNLTFSQEGTDISSLYLDNGYMFFNYNKEEIDAGGDSLDLRFTITEGNQVKIGHVFIRGNTKTKEKVIRRELYTLPGYNFSRDAIVRSQRQISVLNFFDPEKIDIQTPLVDNETVDLVYGVQEKSSDQFNMSAGYSATFGFSGSLGLTFTNFSAQGLFDKDAWRPLPVGDAQRLSLDAQFGLGARYNTFSISYSEPWLLDRPISIGFSVFYTYQNIYYELIQRGFTASLGRRLKWPDDFFRGDWIFRFQENEFHSESVSSFYQTGKIKQVSLTQVISRNSFDNPIYSRTGSNLVINTEFAGSPILPGNAQYQKYKFQLEGFSRIAGDLVLFQSSKYGLLVTQSNSIYAIPYQEFFYMGGSGLSAFETVPMRGYDDRSIGPRTADGIPRGGKNYFKYSSELRYPITLNPQASVYVLGFLDAGNAWDSAAQSNLFDLKRSVGMGVRIFLPFVGMIGLDYGYGLDGVGKTRNPSGWNLTFTFGQGQ